MFLFNLFYIVLLYRLTATKAELYSPDDDVVILSKDSFAWQVLGVKTAWIIEFYNSWCGHCKRFAPKWKSLATDVKAWSSVIQVGAIDCSIPGNLEVCQNYDIKGYPTMRLLLPYSTKDDTGEAFHDQDLVLLKRKMIDFVTNVSGTATASWPNLQPLRSLEHIWEEARNHHKHIALVFEDEKSYTGREVILDMSAYKDVLVRRALKPLMLTFGIKYFPSLYLLNYDGTYQQLAKDSTERERFTEALMIIRGGQDPVEDNEKGDYPVDHDEDNHQDTPRLGVYMQDLESTLTYLLRQEVALHQIMKEESLYALKKFISTLAKYFPGREEIKGFLWRVHTWLKNFNMKQGLSSVHWLHKIDSFQTSDIYLPDTIKWIGCQGSHPQYRGYPCGMWTLFHTLTVSAYKIEKGNHKYNPRGVLDAITGYMKYFFGCSECSKHFLAMAASVDTEVQNINDSVLWLWNAHNMANTRLKGDISEDPKYPKVQFPPRELCARCHKAGGKQAEWDKPQVLKFLVNYYSKENLISINKEVEESVSDNSVIPKNKESMDWWERKQRKKDVVKIWELRESKKKSKENKKNISFLHNDREKVKVLERLNIDDVQMEKSVKFSFGFNDFDIGMCVVFYVMCTVIVFILYYHFAVRRCRFSKKLPL